MFDYSGNANNAMASSHAASKSANATAILQQMTLSPSRVEKTFTATSPPPNRRHNTSVYNTVTPDNRDGSGGVDANGMMISPDKSTSRIMLQAYPTSVEREKDELESSCFQADFENNKDRFRNRLRN